MAAGGHYRGLVATDEGLVLEYLDVEDGSGRLTVHASFEGFSGVGAAYFDNGQLLRFAERILAFPLSQEGSVELAGGFWSRTADVLEEEHVGLRVLPVGQRGQVSIRVHLATPAGEDANQEITVDVLTSYEALRRFSADLVALVNGLVREVTVGAERL